MEKRKIMGIGLSALMFLGIAGAATLPVNAAAYADGEAIAPVEPSEQEPSSPAEPEGAVSLTTENAKLFLPETYEQFLPLQNPSYMAMSERYIAVADGALLYVYNRAEKSYFRFDASLNNSDAIISKIQITDDERLFYSMTGSRLYEYDFSAQTATYHSEVPCSTFLTAEKYLFAVSVTDRNVSLSRYPLTNLTQYGEQKISNNETSIASKLSYANGKLYCVNNDSNISVYDAMADRPQQEGKIFHIDNSISQIPDLKFICVYGGYLYYTVNGAGNYKNGIWRTDFEANAACMLEGDGFSAINSYNGDLYCIQGSSVRKLSVTDGGVTCAGYEIASASSSENRLSGAVDTVRAGRLFVTADAGNKRVSVYNQTTETYSVIPCNFTPAYVATDGETIAVAAEHAVYTCKYGSTTLEQRDLPEGTIGNIRGLACVYGAVYYVTENSVYGRAGETDAAVHSYANNPCRLTRDLYGNLFVSLLNGDVYQFTEDSFLTGGQTGKKLEYSLPANHSSLRADFEGNLYCIANGAVYKNGKKFADINGNDFVYHTEETALSPVSFALGFEDSSVYFNFGNYVVTSNADALPIPTLDKIVTGEIADEVFSVHDDQNVLVDISEKAVGVQIKLGELAGAEYFPYADYTRYTEPRRGVLLGSTERYRLVLLPEGRRYTASLFRFDSVSFTEEDYHPETYEDKGGQSYVLNARYYLSSGVHSYYAPCLEATLQDDELPRGSAVTVVCFVESPERDYALVRFDNGVQDDDTGDGKTPNARAIKMGYVPCSYLSVVSPLPQESAEYLPAYLKASEEGVVFHAKDNEEDTITVTERTAVKAIKNEDGAYTLLLEYHGKTYVADSVKESQIDWKKSDALRIALIIILSTLALVIIGAYIFLLPKKSDKDKPNKKSKKKKAEKSPARKE